MVKGLAVFSMLGVAVAMTAGCQHSASSAPALTGPSQLAMAVTVLANPDRISLDGASQSLITAQVRGPNGQVEVNVPLRVDMVVNGSVQDYGTLSARNVVTGSDGNATAIYTAPALAAGANQPISTVSIQIVIVGTNAVAAVTHSVAIALAPAGVILPPADTPSAAFVVTPTPVNQNVAASFDASSSCPGAKNSVGCLPSSSSVITNYAWTFGDGATANGKTVNHTFTTTGTFNVTLTITNDRGVQNATAQPVAVVSTTTPTAAFTPSTLAPGINQAVNFNAAASTAAPGRTIASYGWSFGDGGTTSGVNVSHAFAAAGSYTVTLTVTDDVGQKGTASQTESVGGTSTLAPPTASFTVSPTAPGVGQTVLFNASASSPGLGHSIASYLWTFGDGVTASNVTTSHAYTIAGSYIVQLKVTDDDGESSTSTATLSPGVGTPAPTANFTFSPAAPGQNDQVVFDASPSSTAAGQTIVDVAWNFGDGTPVIHCPGGTPASCPGPTNRISAHTFQTAQTFQVNLVVTDSAGGIGSHGTSVTVVPALPNVSATASPSGPNPGTTVFFNSNATTYYPGSGPATFFWTFGDGGTSALANPTHSYAAVGTYSVGLSVTDNKGRTGVGGTTVNVVAVTPPALPVPTFTISPAPVTAGVVTNFSSTSTTPSGAAIVSYTWSFGDGVSCPLSCGSGVSPYSAVTHSYPAVGVSGTVTTYNATLTVKDANNQVATSPPVSVPVTTP